MTILGMIESYLSRLDSMFMISDVTLFRSYLFISAGLSKCLQVGALEVWYKLLADLVFLELNVAGLLDLLPPLLMKLLEATFFCLRDMKDPFLLSSGPLYGALNEWKSLYLSCTALYV